MSPLPHFVLHARAQGVRGWQVLQALLVLLVLAVTPASHTPQRREVTAQQVLLATWPQCLWFSLLATLLGVVLIRIVVVTAQSYGLSQYALEMVVRVLVLELLPLMAALFVAMRWSLPTAAELAATLPHSNTHSNMHSHLQTHPTSHPKSHPNSQVWGLAQGQAPTQVAGPADLQAQIDWLANVALARALAGVFAVWLLAAISCVLGLVLSYLLVYGLTPWGLDAYSHMVGRVFSPVVTLIFTLKTLAFSVAVGVVPLASLAPRVGQFASANQRGMEVQGLVRMTVVLLVVELTSLVGNYY